MQKIVKIVSILSIVGALSTGASAASFNCAKASNSIEHAICNDKELNALDTKMGKLYHKIHSKNWRDQHRNMVKMRNEQAENYRDPTKFLVKWAKEEIKELERQVRLGG